MLGVNRARPPHGGRPHSIISCRPKMSSWEVVSSMRWSIIRLIWLRELRDQLRDRRTLFMIAVLPVLLYPIAGFGVMQLALGYLGKQTVLGVQGQQYLPPLTPHCTALSPVPALAWFTLTPAAPGVPLAGVELVAAS